GASGEFADARVDLTGGIDLDATVNSTALTFQSAIVSMVNDTAGSIIFSALASATGTSTATGYEAQAFTDAGWGVRHEVDNQGNGDAVASLANAEIGRASSRDSKGLATSGCITWMIAVHYTH